jgi:hypothetical protein
MGTVTLHCQYERAENDCNSHGDASVDVDTNRFTVFLFLQGGKKCNHLYLSQPSDSLYSFHNSAKLGVLA